MQSRIDPYALIEVLYGAASELVLEPLRPYLEVSCEYGALLVKDALRRSGVDELEAEQVAHICDQHVMPKLRERFLAHCLERGIVEADRRVVLPALIHARIATEEELVIPSWDAAARTEIERHMLAAGAAMPVGSFFLRILYELVYLSLHTLVLIAFVQAIANAWSPEEAVEQLRQLFEQRALVGNGEGAALSFQELYVLEEEGRSQAFQNVLAVVAENADDW